MELPKQGRRHGFFVQCKQAPSLAPGLSLQCGVRPPACPVLVGPGLALTDEFGPYIHLTDPQATQGTTITVDALSLQPDRATLDQGHQCMAG